MKDPTQATPYSRRLGDEESYWTMSYLMTWPPTMAARDPRVNRPTARSFR